MKRLLIVWMLCSLLAAGAFGVLLLEDRLLDVPLPYSLSFAFGSVLVLTCALFALTERLRARRPIVVRVAAAPAPAFVPAPEPEVASAPVREQVRSAPRPRRLAQGLVLLDFSSMRPCPERAA